MTMTLNFDAWRARYDRMSYVEDVEFYRQVAAKYPEQQQFNASAVGSFLDGIGPVSVLELGGWKGELAALMLARFPSIGHWLNVDIAPQVVGESRCADPRYRVLVPSDYLWNLDLDLSGYRAMVASHVIEHLKVADVHRLMQRISRVRYLYIDVPLSGEPSSWYRDESSHILEVGWDGLLALVQGYGFTVEGQAKGDYGQAMWFVRETAP